MITHHALLIIDVQNDFCPNGNLAVPNGAEIVPTVNALAEKFTVSVLTQDWHPQGHSSFASSHSGKQPLEIIQMEYGAQTLWPDHCVQGSKGAAFHPDLVSDKADLIIRKGYHQKIDSYSAFLENDKKTTTGLAGYLRERELSKLFLCGLATDFCVNFSAIDAIDHGFEVTLILDACRGIDIEGSVDAAIAGMKDKGVRIINSGDL